MTNTFRNASGIECLDEIALDLARGHSLAVVETTNFPLAEWAASARATNLLDGATASSSLSNEVAADLDRAVFFGNNNGWTGQHEKRHARAHLVVTPEQDG